MRDGASSDPAVDWVDEGGFTYDAVGGFSPKYFDHPWGNRQVRIDHHTAKADFVPVDVSGFTSEQIAKVEKFVEPLRSSVFIVGR